MRDLFPVENRVPLPKNATLEDIINLLYKIYRKPYIREVVISREEIVVRRNGFVDDPILEGDPTDLTQVLSSVEMEEIEAANPFETLFNIFFRISIHGLAVSHIFVGSIRSLRRWLRLPEMVSLGGNVFGCRVMQAPIADDVLIACGSPHRGMDIGCIQRVIKISMVEKPDASSYGKDPTDGHTTTDSKDVVGQMGVTWGG